MQNLQLGEGYSRPHVSEMVINWHFTEACNYKCRYCYAKWQGNDKELLHDWGRTQNLLNQLSVFFLPENMANPLRQSKTWSGIRLNLAGGDPLLHPHQIAATGSTILRALTVLKTPTKLSKIQINKCDIK